ncbi:hypothetical protein HDU91_000167 [Kappamyces sp. JEL0680]|nr:hypothetical protein HDU91_000167 [Kappamyces sp. JEL0680]
MNTGFQASTIPASTIIPKYHEIMSQQSNKATTVRLAANLKRKEQLMQSAAAEGKLVPKSTKSEILKREHLQLRLESEKLVHQLEAEVRSSADEKKRAAAERIRCRLGKSSDGKRLQDRQEKVKQKLEYQKSLEKSFQGQMDDMQKRIDARRCLFEQVQIDAARNQALSSVRQVLAAAGVEIKDLA